MIKFEIFKRTYCPRTFTGLGNPKLVTTTEVELPYSTVLHHRPDNEVQLGINEHYPLLINEDNVWVHHVETLIGEAGRPRTVPVNVNSLKTQYFKSDGGIFNRVRNLRRALGLSRHVVVMDYALLSHTVKYTERKDTFFNKADNLRQTMWETTQELDTQGVHFIPITLPEVVPSYGELSRLPNPIPTSRYEAWEDVNRLDVKAVFDFIGATSTPLDEVATDVVFVISDNGLSFFLDARDLLTWGLEDPDKTRRYFVSALNVLAGKRLPEEVSEAIDDVDVDTSDVEVEDGVAIGLFDTNQMPVGKDTIAEQIVELGSAGLLSGAEQKRLTKLSTAYETIPAPTGEGTLKEFIETKPDIVKLDALAPDYKDNNTILDKSMLSSTLAHYDKTYISEFMERDIAAVVLNLQNAGVMVKSYKVEEEVDASTEAKVYKIELVPVNGKPSTLTFKLPKVRENGEYYVGGVKYRMDHQKSDIPIRKVFSNRVALTSYYGKLFIDRNNKAANNLSRWLTNRISKTGMDKDNGAITEVGYSTKALPKSGLTRYYSAIASQISYFVTPTYRFEFHTSEWEKHYDAKAIKTAEKNNLLLCGFILKGKQPIAMDADGVIYRIDNTVSVPIGGFTALVDERWGQPPVEYVDVNVYGKAIPLGVALAYYMGLEKLLKRTKIKHRWVEAKARLNLQPFEARIKFADESLIIDTRNKVGALLLGGFNGIAKAVEQYPAVKYNTPGVYGEVLNSVGIGRHCLKELTLIKDMFIDPITNELLTQIDEPNEIIGLLIRATELLVNDDYVDEIDSAYMRIRGYERFSGFVYNQLVNAVREQRNAIVPSRSSVSLNPKSVWGDILMDPSVVLVEESNPLHNLKEMESVTYTGQGGRSAKTMVQRTRLFHPNDIGVISESTPDSAKVAIRTYMTPNAKLNSLRGTTDRYDFDKDGPTSALSTTALLLPGATSNDPKRTNFSSIQLSSMVSCKGAKLHPVRTGYEQIVPKRVADKYAHTAKDKGKVTAVSDTSITVQYKDGQEETIKLGKAHGKAAGAIVPQTIITNLKVGDTFDKETTLAWDEAHFKMDRYGGDVSVATGTLANVVFMETNDTLEDGSVISQSLSEQLATPVGKMKAIIVDFEKAIEGVVALGAEVDLDTPLLTIQDAAIAELAKGDEAALGLSKLANQSPKANFKGTVTNMEIFYMGNVEDMHPTLQTLVKADNRRRAQLAKMQGQALAKTGEVKEPTFINGEKLIPNRAVITFYMDKEIGAGFGDKVVFDNALKSVIGRVLPEDERSESGVPIQAIFGQESVSARIVDSVNQSGTTIRTLQAISKAVVDAYRS